MGRGGLSHSLCVRPPRSSRTANEAALESDRRKGSEESGGIELAASDDREGGRGETTRPKNTKHRVTGAKGGIQSASDNCKLLYCCCGCASILANFPMVRSDFFHANLLNYVLYFQLLKDCWELVGTFFEQLEIQYIWKGSREKIWILPTEN